MHAILNALEQMGSNARLLASADITPAALVREFGLEASEARAVAGCNRAQLEQWLKARGAMFAALVPAEDDQEGDGDQGDGAGSGGEESTD